MCLIFDADTRKVDMEMCNVWCGFMLVFGYLGMWFFFWPLA